MKYKNDDFDNMLTILNSYDSPYNCSFDNQMDFKRRGPYCSQNKKEPLQLNVHYSNHWYENGATHSLFGKAGKYEYVYSDRLYGQFYSYCYQRAVQLDKCVAGSAEAYEKALSHYYGAPIEIKNIQAGVNSSSGYSYAVYGFVVKGDGKTHSIDLEEEFGKEVVREERKALKTFEKECQKIVTTHNSAKSQIKHNTDSIKQLKKEIEDYEKEINTLTEQLPVLAENSEKARQDFAAKAAKFESKFPYVREYLTLNDNHLD